MSKKWTRRGALALIGSGASMLIWGTSGFTMVESERDSTLGTAADSEALLGIAGPETVTGVPGQTVTLRTLTNNFDQPLTDIQVSPRSESPFETMQTPNTLQSGENGDVTTTLSCDSGGDSTVTLDITATGNDQGVELSRSVSVQCRDPRVSWWHFEDISGTSVPDSWAGSNDGERDDVGRLYPAYEPDLVTSQQGRGEVLNFDGDDVVTVPDNDTLDLTDDFSLSAWVYPRSQDGLTRLFSKWNSRGDDSYQLGFGGGWQSSGNRELLIETTDEYKLTGVSLTENQWAHVVWTHGSEDKVYANGTQKGPTFSLPDAEASTQPLRIGNGLNSRRNAVYGFDGVMDEPKVYDAALTVDQVSNLYDSSTASEGGGGGDITG
ncbi:LamG domain-containing protein [Halorhabdus sp. CBA1104]|uniref:LamG domain-containing protein n=1 Tax=Halorhabdus sp. CBA1104 TaxID=1380432 RepID=UPI0012B4182F|nr:LamG domain-containing protein [Halorhabdus sp. CBA1104]QGN07451.1 LamG domain-containing protein [Halorhabdus sp. CBA1104]